MSILRIPYDIYEETYKHLFGTHGEHFAFFLADWTSSNNEPVFLVKNVILIPDKWVTFDGGGFELDFDGILEVVNQANKGGRCLIEIHNHGGNLPRFSHTDLQGLEEFPDYIFDSLLNRPYGATVWGDKTVYGEYFLPDGKRGLIQSITVLGEKYSQIVSRNDDLDVTNSSFDRQKIWFSESGQKQLGRYKIGVVGCGGTGSHIIQQLTYLGCRDFLIIDDDIVEKSNLNRMVTATASDIGVSKVILAKQLINRIAPLAEVRFLQKKLQSSESIDMLKGTDFIFGCVDNDGARLILNELALAYNIPFIDVASGIILEGENFTDIGGRFAFVLPKGPCLYCMGEIDHSEASFFNSSNENQDFALKNGYVSGAKIDAPSVVSINGMIVSLAVTEFALYLSGIRSASRYQIIDSLGLGRNVVGQWVYPEVQNSSSGCVQCELSGVGDIVNIERYIL